MSAGWLINNFRSTYSHAVGRNVYSCLFIQSRDYAARKGTREKARKKKLKLAAQKVGYNPELRKKRISKEKARTSPITIINYEDLKKESIDDVWFLKYHKPPVYSFKEAIEFHRETHHPTMYNTPNANVCARIGLNLQSEKKTKTISRFTKIINTPHLFDTGGKRSVLAFSKTAQDQESAKEAGADFVGGIELIKQIQSGDFPYKEYDHIVAHPDILADLLLIRGLLKRNFPNAKHGSLSNNLARAVKMFMHGIQYTMEPNKTFQHYGQIYVAFGTLDMDLKQLEENWSFLINDIYSMKPKINEPFILRVEFASPPSHEMFKIDLEPYLPKKTEPSGEDGEEDENNSAAVIATN
ncbi:50S ribosomal protein L1 [Hylaeus volcanicus]|uniref:50S ribosomal protein L1 n=1 Tax=Hylaeus volcanicus TaxID=313075 RepID=UPI0023B82875|nr:50S ribosomal protein L1 [Hylaeus volcanicus]